MDNTTLEKKVKDARNEYFRNWRKKNKDKIKEYNNRYWEKKAKELEKQA